MAETLDPTPESAGAVATSALVGRRLGRYEILCHLATGGMATVYVGRALGLAGFERLVAIKLLHPHLAHEEDFIAMFLDEARLAARIRHPNVVGTQDISDSEGDGFFLVMDYVEGDHLARMLGRAVKRSIRLEEPIVARILVDALTGLDAAHHIVDERGEPLRLVHRDVSPENILLGTDGVVRVTDFGVARAEVRVASTRAGQFKGKIAYMAPEQAATGECDQRSDLFSMGVVLWESLTAKRLFRGDSNATTLSRLLNDPIPAPSRVDSSLAPWDALLAKALERDPARRFQSASEMAEAIEEVAADRGGLASPRMLAAAVSELVGEKIAEEQQRIRAALDAYSVADEDTKAGGPLDEVPSGTIRVRATNPKIPIPSTGPRITIAGSGSQPGIRAADPMTASGEYVMTGQYSIIEAESQKTAVILTASLILVAIAAGIAGYFASRADREVQPVIVQAPREPLTAPTLEPSTLIAVPPALAANGAGFPDASVTEAAGNPAPIGAQRPGSRRHDRRPAIPIEDNPYRVGN